MKQRLKSYTLAINKFGIINLLRKSYLKRVGIAMLKES